MYKEHIILGLFWIMYCFIHSLLAHENVKDRIGSYFNISRSLYRIGYNIFAFVSLAGLLLYHYSINVFLLFRIPFINGLLATIFIITGILIMIICIRKYFLQLSGIRSQTLEKPVLETGGIHRYVRHPLYLGTFIFITGLFLKYPYLSNLIALTIIILYTVIGITFEENKLLQEFGDDYKDYKKKVPMLFPFLK